MDGHGVLLLIFLTFLFHIVSISDAGHQGGRATGHHRGLHRISSGKTRRETASVLKEANLEELAKEDPVAAIVRYIEWVKRRSSCDKSVTLSPFKYVFPTSPYERFSSQTQNAVKTANVLNNLFRSWDLPGPETLYIDAFFKSMVRALVENDSQVFGSTIAFDPIQFGGRSFCPLVYRDSGGRLTLKDQDQVSRHRYGDNGTDGYEWFWRLRSKPYLEQRQHEPFCSREAAGGDPSISAAAVITSEAEGMWTDPYYDCNGSNTWIITYSVPFFGCTKQNTHHFKGVVAMHFDINQLEIDQCSKENTTFADTHKCRNTTKCVSQPVKGFQLGGYTCECEDEYYFSRSNHSNHCYYNGSRLEEEHRKMLLNLPSAYNTSFQCLPCLKGGIPCNGTSPCFADYDVMLRGIPLGIQSFCMTIAVVVGLVILRLRKCKVMKASMWTMLEIMIVGALLLYATVLLQYFEPSNATCLLIPWFREVGFAILFGALILKIYRVLAEFQSRKAHRVHVRDKDLLKYLLGIALVVIGYVSAWTAVNMDHIHDGDSMLEVGRTPDQLNYHICKSFWWDYVIEIGEFLFMCLGIYLCYCVRSAPSDYGETRYISIAIYLETVVSAFLHIIRHFMWLDIHPDYIFLMYFIRCQLTVTVALIVVIGPKLWYAHRPPEDDAFRHRTYSTSDVHDTILPESMKLHVGVSSNGDVDVGEINLAEMDPEDIRTELKRLYTQLQIYKTKTMRKDNPHISKRRGGRKQTHRRFSLQAFHYKHRHHHSASTSDHDHEHEMSKTPEESTNSAEGVAIQMEGSSRGGEEERTPTVTFKPGHKSFS